MIKIGQFNQLQVLKEVPFGLYLDGEEWGEILLPSKAVPAGTHVHDLVDVFVYFDSEDKIIATTLKPRATVGMFACLKVVDVNRAGAFLDWGLSKDLLVPRTEQKRPMEIGKSYIVYVQQDESERISASSKIDYFLDKLSIPYKAGDEVNLLIADRTDLGVKVIINNAHWGLVHHNDILQPLQYGRTMKGYIKNLREDGKLDVELRKVSDIGTPDLAKKILSQLKDQGGFIPLHDKSSPLEIDRAFAVSKKNFKIAIGNLYKQGKITIEASGIRLCKK